jgi:general secretion pathway protein H
MTPISAIGETRPDAGFTLIEMMAVLAIVGLAAGAVLLTAPDSRRSLIQEAERFAASLVRAKEEAVLTNRTIDVRITPEGYSFGATSRGLRRPLEQRSFATVEWSEDTTAIVSEASDRSRIAFDSTGIVTPAAVDLFRSGGQVRVSIDVAGSIRIDVARR